MGKHVLIILAAALSSCQSTRYEMFQGVPIELEPGQELVKTRHSHNLEIWLKNQSKKIGGGTPGKADAYCPVDLGHGLMTLNDNY